jgi:hypothetical protein
MHLTMEKTAMIHIKKSTSANMKTTIIGSNTENGKKNMLLLTVNSGKSISCCGQTPKTFRISSYKTRQQHYE